MAKSEVVRLRCTDSKKERWQEAADEQGLSLSSWLEDAADAACEFLDDEGITPIETAPLLGRDKGYLPAEKEREIARLTALVEKYEAGTGPMRPSFRARVQQKGPGGGCTFDTPRGTKCKACGKTH